MNEKVVFDALWLLIGILVSTQFILLLIVMEHRPSYIKGGVITQLGIAASFGLTNAPFMFIVGLLFPAVFFLNNSGKYLSTDRERKLE
jgi:uncharacterized membrane protein